MNTTVAAPVLLYVNKRLIYQYFGLENFNLMKKEIRSFNLSLFPFIYIYIDTLNAKSIQLFSTMSHTSGTTHPSSQGHSHKHTIEQLANAVNENHLNNLDKYLDDNVQKTVDSQVVYKNLKEARDYYTKEHDNKKTAHWNIIKFHDDQQQGNTIRAQLSHDNKTYNITYTFSNAGKIQRIDSTTDHSTTTTTTTH